MDARSTARGGVAAVGAELGNRASSSRRPRPWFLEVGLDIERVDLGPPGSAAVQALRLVAHQPAAAEAHHTHGFIVGHEHARASPGSDSSAATRPTGARPTSPPASHRAAGRHRPIARSRTWTRRSPWRRGGWRGGADHAASSSAFASLPRFLGFRLFAKNSVAAKKPSVPWRSGDRRIYGPAATSAGGLAYKRIAPDVRRPARWRNPHDVPGSLDLPLVSAGSTRAGGVDQPAARLHQARRGVEDRGLLRDQLGQILGPERPAAVGIAPPRATPTGHVDQHAVEGARPGASATWRLSGVDRATLDIVRAGAGRRWAERSRRFSSTSMATTRPLLFMPAAMASVLPRRRRKIVGDLHAGLGVDQGGGRAASPRPGFPTRPFWKASPATTDRRRLSRRPLLA